MPQAPLSRIAVLSDTLSLSIEQEEWIRRIVREKVRDFEDRHFPVWAAESVNTTGIDITLRRCLTDIYVFLTRIREGGVRGGELTLSLRDSSYATAIRPYPHLEIKRRCE